MQGGGGSGLFRLARRQAQAREIQLTMPGIAEGERVIRDHFERDRAQPCNRGARLVEPPHMGIAGRQKTVGRWESRRILYRDTEPWHRLFETSAEEQRCADQPGTSVRVRAWAEPEGHLSVLDRQIRFA